MKISKLLFLSFVLLFSMGIAAQTKQEVGAYLGGGLSTLNYKHVDGRVDNRMGFSLGFSYRYFLAENWAIQSGLELSKYNSEINQDVISGKIDAVDDEMENFEYLYTLGGYNEKQNSYFMNIPIMINYQTGNSSKMTNVYAAAGFKLGLPVSTKYTSSIASITTSGYYSANDVTYDDLLFRGFGTFTDVKTKDKVKSNMQVMLSAEFGLKNRIGEKLFIYTGLYFDYGLNDLTSKNKNFIEYNTNEPLSIRNQSILNSRIHADSETKKLVNKVNAMSFGVKVNLAFEL